MSSFRHFADELPLVLRRFETINVPRGVARVAVVLMRIEATEDNDRLSIGEEQRVLAVVIDTGVSTDYTVTYSQRPRKNRKITTRIVREFVPEQKTNNLSLWQIFVGCVLSELRAIEVSANQRRAR